MQIESKNARKKALTLGRLERYALSGVEELARRAAMGRIDAKRAGRVQTRVVLVVIVGRARDGLVALGGLEARASVDGLEVVRRGGRGRGARSEGHGVSKRCELGFCEISGYREKRALGRRRGLGETRESMTRTSARRGEKTWRVDQLERRGLS